MPLPVLGMIAGALGRGLIGVGMRVLGGGVMSAAGRGRRQKSSPGSGGADGSGSSPDDNKSEEASRGLGMALLGLTGRITATAASVSVLHRGFVALSSHTLSQAEGMRRYSSVINSAVLELQKYEVGRSVRIGSATGGGVAALASAVEQRRRAAEPLEAAATNLSNSVQAAMAKGSAALLALLDKSGIDEAMNYLADMIFRWIGEENAKEDREEFVQFDLRRGVRDILEGQWVPEPGDNIGRPNRLQPPRNDI